MNEPEIAQCDVEQYVLVIQCLAGVVVALFGWLMKAKADHFKDLREALSEARRRASGAHG